MIDLTSLEALAKAATPGPWIRFGVRHKIGPESCIAVGQDGAALAYLPIGSQQGDKYSAVAFNDAAFIAAANPAAVLELIAMVRAAGAPK